MIIFYKIKLLKIQIVFEVKQGNKQVASTKFHTIKPGLSLNIKV